MLHKLVDAIRQGLAANREYERLISMGMRHDPALRVALSISAATTGRPIANSRALTGLITRTSPLMRRAPWVGWKLYVGKLDERRARFGVLVFLLLSGTALIDALTLLRFVFPKILTKEKNMHEQSYVHRAIVSPAAIFKSPMEVVAANGIELIEKVAILKAWEADERALLRAEDEGMSGGEHAHLHKVLAALEHLKN
jgi:hypothetical protein